MRNKSMLLSLVAFFSGLATSIAVTRALEEPSAEPVEIAQELADEVMNDLDKLSRFLGRNPDGRGSVEAHALLPSELWDAFPSEEMDRLKSWCRVALNCEMGNPTKSTAELCP